ncbi:hypothetical protein PR048_009018 [Dryococelus australis]|uniref:Uncharacterized protein n=1 Tax=Dryococelus australis TaxID=614101 RepID=A0ABQ9HYS4_9NEOP|nr:hypothetical protein PR048_009018 [Dryococelus australis]
MNMEKVDTNMSSSIPYGLTSVCAGVFLKSAWDIIHVFVCAGRKFSDLMLDISEWADTAEESVADDPGDKVWHCKDLWG